MIEIHLLIDDVDADESLMLVGELNYRYGDRWAIGRRVLIDDVEAVYGPADADEDDVDEEMLLTVLRNATERVRTQHPDVSFGLDDLMHALQAPPPAQRHQVAQARITQVDQAPPHGLARPDRVRPTDQSPRARQIKAQIIDDVKCPRCGAPAGHSCGSSKTPGQNYGTGHVHAERIDLWYQQ